MSYKRNHLSEGDVAALAQVRLRHPHRTSTCGALLAELASPDAALEDRSTAARLYGQLGCRRGLHRLEAEARRVSAEILASLTQPNDYPAGPERFYFAYLVKAIALIDHQASHAVLKDLLGSLPQADLRSDVIEAMAFEGTMFEVEIVNEILQADSERPVLLSALYTLWFHPPSRNESVALRLLLPLLDHESADVRSYAVRALTNWDNAHLAVTSLANDPDPDVRETVADVLRT